MKISRREYGIHLLVVAICLVALNLPNWQLTFGVFTTGTFVFLWVSLLGAAGNLVLFYGIVNYLIPKLLKSKGGFRFFIALLLLFLVVSVVEIGIDAFAFALDGGNLGADEWGEIIIAVTVFNMLIIILAFAYRFVKDWFANEKMSREMNELKLKSELHSLKAQINPHFLFNALNNLFSMALQNQDEDTAEGISKLAEIMRYTLEHGNKSSVPLASEIQYIEDYIYLQKLRFEENVKVNFQFPTNKVLPHIEPMLLQPFVENAFKYGVSTQEKTEIDIMLKAENTKITFQIINQIVVKSEAVESHKIGIENVKKRLELTYPNTHQLNIDSENSQFKVTLTIDTV